MVLKGRKVVNQTPSRPLFRKEDEIDIGDPKQIEEAVDTRRKPRGTRQAAIDRHRRQQ
jgi:hypothetical protein